MTMRNYMDKELHQTVKEYGYYCILPILFAVCSIFTLRLLSKERPKLPPGPIGLPLIGYLPFLGKEAFRDLDELCKKYGNVYSLYLGRTYVVILGDITAVKDAFSKAASSGRPPGLFDILPDASGTFISNGEEWIEQRGFIVRSMKDIGLGRSTWSRLVEDEVSDVLRELEEKKGDPIDIDHFLTSSVSSNIASLLFGKRLPPGPERDNLNSSLESAMAFFSQASLWNYFPSLCKMLVKLKITSYYKSSCDMITFNKLIRKHVDSHRHSPSGLKGNDFVTTYIEEMQRNEAEEEEKETTFTETNLIGNTQSLYIGGTDTAKGSLTWLFLAMAVYPDVQAKVHQELVSVLGKEERAAWEDHAKFPYTYATIMEGQRWRTVVPLGPSRLAMEDIKVCGYDVPKGSTIIANIWGIHNDARYWTEPEKFIPDRFLQNDGKEVTLKPESYVPFSYGKRKCPGDIASLMEIFLYFTAMMQKFEVKAPNGRHPKLDGVLGLT